MNVEAYIEHGLAKPGAREDRPFGPEPLVFKIGGKMFALFGGSGVGATVSLKCDPETALMLRHEFEGVKPGYHLNKTHWNTVTLDGKVPERDVLWMIDHSYALVTKSLTKRERAELGI